MDETVLKLAQNVVERYRKSLFHFRPCKPGSELLEQNLITLLSHEFMVMFNDDDRCVAYSEIPFKSEKQPDKWSNRLDGFLANKDMAFVVEAKSTKHKDDLIIDIKADLKRIHSDELKDSFREMASSEGRTYQIPSSVHGLVIADFWCLSASQPWFTASEFEARLFPEYRIKAMIEKVGTYGRYDYFLLVAQTNALAW